MGSEHVFISRSRRNFEGQREHAVALEEGANDEDCRRLVALENVTALRVHSSHVTDSGFALLCEHKSIESLQIESGDQLTSEAAVALAELYALASYSGIEWHRPGVTSALSTLPALRSCSIVDAGLTDEEIRPLGARESLESLTADGNAISGIGFADFGPFRSLTTLSVGRNQLSQEGLDCLASINSVELLALSGLRLGSLSLACLARLERMAELHLENSVVGNIHIRDLRGCNPLKRLWMSYEQLQSVGIDEVVELRQLRQLLVCGEAPQELLDSLRAAFREAGVDCLVEP